MLDEPQLDEKVFRGYKLNVDSSLWGIMVPIEPLAFCSSSNRDSWAWTDIRC